MFGKCILNLKVSFIPETYHLCSTVHASPCGTGVTVSCMHFLLAGPPTVFAVVTANSTEENTVRHFLKLGDIGTIWDGASDCTWENDPYLKKNGVIVENEGVLDDSYEGVLDNYEIFTLTKEGGSEKVIGVHVKCQQQAAFTEGGAQDTTTDLLKCARSYSWKLSDLFSVGCCSFADDGISEGNLMGHVLLTSELEAYLNRGKMTEDSHMQHHPEVYKTDRDWISRLQNLRITKPALQPGTDSGKFKDIPVKEVPRFEVGPFVVKSAEYAADVRGVAYRVGIEMEAVGFMKALGSCQRQGYQNIPKFAVVKGVSDGGQDKRAGGKTNFFGKETEKVKDDVRQQVATLHSIALVIRGVVDKYLCAPPAVNPNLLPTRSSRT